MKASPVSVRLLDSRRLVRARAWVVARIRAGRGVRAVSFAALLTLVLGDPRAGLGFDIAGRVVDGSGEPLSDAVVFLEEPPRGMAKPPSEPRKATLDQIHKEFVPRVLPVALGTEVSFPNHDQIHHHVYSFSRAKTFETPLYKGESAPPVLFDKLGAVKIGCNIHDWMSAVILVVPTAFFAVTDDRGTFVIRNLPAGTYSLAAWHEGSKTSARDSAQSVLIGKSARAPLTFKLDVETRTPRAGARGGVRSYDR